MAISFNSLGGYGRLGNQMFQYASLRGIAKNRGYDFSIPSDGHRLFDIFEMKHCINKEKNNIVMQSLTHSGFEFDQELFNTCPNYTDLYGYFQSEKYFYNISDSIKEDFSFLNTDDETLSNFNNKEIVSIHVRRGDYLGLQTYHPIVSMDYYKKAMSFFKGCSFLLFSDDIEWCKSEETFQECTIIEGSDSNSMYLMSKCNHNIIANSSFSWWSAWLNNNPNKKIIAPKNWFGPSYSSYNMSDLYPESWEVI